MPSRDATPNKPTRKLAEKLRHDIHEGVHSPDLPFPSLRDLAREHGVSMRVVQGAMAILEAEGLIQRRERRGTFVRGAALAIPQRGKAGQPALRCVNFVERSSGTLPDFVRSSYMHGYTEALEHLDVKMRVVNCPERGGDINDIASSLFSPLFPFQQQGCVLINLVSPNLIQWLNGHDVPFVIQKNASYEREDLPPHHSVIVNKFAGGMAAVRHLAGLGHERIGYVGRREVGDGELAPLYRGYEAAMCEAGLDVLDQDVLEISRVGSVHESLLLYLARAGRPTAIITETDMLAIGVMQTAQAMDLNIPKDLSIVGYDDQEDASACDPPLTTVSSRRSMLARSAVKLLFEVIAGKHKTPRHEILQPRLVERQTTAKPRTPPKPGRVPQTIGAAWRDQDQS